MIIQYTSKTNSRNSSIELLKILSMLLIIISHWVQTIYHENRYVDFCDYLIPIDLPSDDLYSVFLVSLKYLGIVGNNLFLVASIWFLLDSNSINVRKMLRLECNILFASVSIMLVFCFFWHSSIDNLLVFSSFFPTLFNNNWFVSCYFLLYFIHPILNKIINEIPKEYFKKLCIALILLYGIFQMLISGVLFASKLIDWISVYLCIGYFKKFMINQIQFSIKKYVFVALGTFSALVFLIFVTNYCALLNKLTEISLLKWDKDYNVFVVSFALSVFCIVKNSCFHNIIINRISSVLFLVYVIHENIFVRYYLRPSILQSLSQAHVCGSLIQNILILSVITYVLSLILGFVINYIVDFLYKNITKYAYFNSKL